MQSTRRFRQERVVNIVDTAQGSSSSDESYYADGISISTDVIDVDGTQGEKKRKKYCAQLMLMESPWNSKWTLERNATCSQVRH